MGRQRTPTAIARATGAAAKNPKRYKGRSAPAVASLGDPPDYLTEAQANAWQTFADEMPWLAASDRTITELAARLRARMGADPDFGVNAIAQLRLCLSAMGGTPTDRSKINDAEPDDDPLAAFVN